MMGAGMHSPKLSIEDSALITSYLKIAVNQMIIVGCYSYPESVFCRSVALARDHRSLKAAPTKAATIAA